MINGHGDDIYQYGGIRCNFSSNISPMIDTRQLRQYLAERLEVIDHYPEPDAHSLEVLIAAKHCINTSEVLVTSGATDAIYLIAQTLRDERTFAVKRPTFSEYADACRVYDYEEIVGEASKLCAVGEASKLHTLSNVYWLCNPNNPTGEVVSTDTVQELSLRHHWLVIDQSYEDYTYEPMLSAQTAIDMQNVIAVHSMTKRFAIPGLRLGYIVAPSAVIARLRANYRPWAVNALAIEAGIYLLQSLEASPTTAQSLEASPTTQSLERLLEETRSLRNCLREIPGIHVYPTSTNFMLCSIRHSTAAELKEYLLARHGFLIRDASNFKGLSARHFRIATQLPEFNQELVEAIRSFCSQK